MNVHETKTAELHGKVARFEVPQQLFAPVLTWLVLPLPKGPTPDFGVPKLTSDSSIGTICTKLRTAQIDEIPFINLSKAICVPS